MYGFVCYKYFFNLVITAYRNEQQGDIHRVDHCSRYYWESASEDELRRYYGYRNRGYICPTCRCIVLTFEEFFEGHRYAAGFTRVSKHRLFLESELTFQNV